MTEDTDKHALIAAAKDTLMNIAGVSGVAAMDLRPGQSLLVDLGLDDTGLAVLAVYQQRVANRIRGDDTASPIDIERFREAVVWQILAMTVCHAIGDTIDAGSARRIIAAAQDALRGTGAPSA